MTTTAWVAVAAFCISLSTLIANVTLTWLKWPRIVVEVAVRQNSTVKSVGLASGHDAQRLD